jgi:hypothetical protein
MENIPREIGGEMPEKKEEESELVKGIQKRAATASQKVKERVEEILIPKLKVFENPGGRKNFGERWLSDLQEDFYYLAKDPNDEIGGGQYPGWEGREIEELYYVLYGKKME